MANLVGNGNTEKQESRGKKYEAVFDYLHPRRAANSAYSMDGGGD